MPNRRKPIEDHTRAGTYRPARHQNCILPPSDPGEFDTNPPEWLSEGARCEWNRVTPLLKARGVLRPEDASLLAIYCGAFANLRATLESGGAPRAADLSAFNNLAAKLGLSPADRTKTVPAEIAAKPRRDGYNPGEFEEFRTPLRPFKPEPAGGGQ